MSFTPRLVAPSRDDPNVISTRFGGNNSAWWYSSGAYQGLCMPNCTGYVHMRYLELYGKKVETKLCLNDATKYWDYNDGLVKSQTPSLGAICCWSSSGSSTRGHVGVVEEVYSNGDFLASMSNYSGTWWYLARFTKESGYKLYSSKSTYYFQGFKNMPNEIEKVGTPVQRNETRHQIGVTYAALRARKRPEINDAVVLGYINMGYYNVLDVKDMTYEPSNGYLWFKVEKNMWVAYVDGCVDDYPVDEESELAKLKARVKELETDIISYELTIEKLRDKLDKIKKLVDNL